MPRLVNPVNWEHVPLGYSPANASNNPETTPLVTLRNSAGHVLHVHPISERLVRVVHALAPLKEGAAGFTEREIQWETRRESGDAGWSVKADANRKHITLLSPVILRGAPGVRIELDYAHAAALSWYWDVPPEAASPAEENLFLQDFKNAYTYDASSRRVYHYITREPYMPHSEYQPSANANHPAHPGQTEFVYGLGETKGPLMKTGKRYIIEGRDSLGYDSEETDPLYKLCPFTIQYNARTRFWYGLYYNTLSPSIFDLGAEHDFSTGNWRSFTAEHGPLDYYLLLGEDDVLEKGVRIARAPVAPNVPAIVSQFAKLVTPHCPGLMGSRERGPSAQKVSVAERNATKGWQASPTLPPLSQFGYLASSLTLSERADAQDAVIEYVRETRRHGFPIEGMHLSSGYCQDPQTGERNFFTWDLQKYPDPSALGRILERELGCQLILNVKPWLLESHPWYNRTAAARAFVRAAPDTRPPPGGAGATGAGEGAKPADPDRCGPYEAARTLHWSVNMGDTGKGSYIDYTSRSGYEQWESFMQKGMLSNEVTGIWIDNNEFSTLMDDLETFRGEIEPWSLSGLESIPISPSQSTQESVQRLAKEVAARMGWKGGEIAMGAVGRGVQTMGMAKASFDALLRARPDIRPFVVTRSAVPGMQAFAHGTWSGDNATTWKALKWGTKMTLSVGMSFGPGLYGHDIGGFAGAHSPSAELLVRWCQQSMWHTRFTVHSWKKISTTLWMYDHLPGITDLLRATVHFRYRLAPSLYSLFVTQYHRHGWPVLKPLLWHHSSDFTTLTQDEQFLFGSHLLVAPVLDFGARSVSFNLPEVVDGEKERAWWCEWDSGRWEMPSAQDSGSDITLDAPLGRCPALVRDGGIIVLGGPCPRTIFDGLGSRSAYIFPLPAAALRPSPDPSGTYKSKSTGRFTLIEDDGRSNAAAFEGAFTEIEIWFETDWEHGKDEVRVGFDVVHAGYPVEFPLEFVLPHGDTRKLVLGDASAVVMPLLEEVEKRAHLGLQVKVDVA